jgi:E3 ubiquitin-protein ligase DOA10
MEENKPTCRFCLEEDIVDNLLSPCKCKGTSKYVHKKCILDWDRNHCPTCKLKYDIVYPDYVSLEFRLFLAFMLIFSLILYCIEENRKRLNGILINKLGTWIDFKDVYWFTFVLFLFYVYNMLKFLNKEYASSFIVINNYDKKLKYEKYSEEKNRNMNRALRDMIELHDMMD